MKKPLAFIFPLLVPLACSLSSCEGPKVELTFIQHTYVYDIFENEEELRNVIGLVLEDDEIKKTTFSFNWGYKFTKDDIEYFHDNVSIFKFPPSPPHLGYFKMTRFYTKYDTKTRIANNELKPRILTKDMTLHFGVC